MLLGWGGGCGGQTGSGRRSRRKRPARGGSTSNSSIRRVRAAAPQLVADLRVGFTSQDVKQETVVDDDGQRRNPLFVREVWVLCADRGDGSLVPTVTQPASDDLSGLDRDGCLDAHGGPVRKLAQLPGPTP